MSAERPPLPLVDLLDARAEDLRADVLPALASAALTVPQGLAYALIAGLPPAVGLYAATVPTIVGALFRSSRNTLVGPTNALSVVVATSVLADAPDRAAAAATVAMLVGLLQIAAGVLRLGGIADYVSASVVGGYVAGAATLIVVGQLPNVTGTDPIRGDLLTRVIGWLGQLRAAEPLSVGVAVATAAFVVAVRDRLPRGVPMLAGLLAAVGVTRALRLDAAGLAMLSDGVPSAGSLGLPPFALPSASGLVGLLPVAAAATVLSLVESTSVARVAAERIGQRLDLAADFVGLGLANVAAALFGGYPVSGSLARTGIAVSLGARTRLVGVWSGLVLLLALPLLGPVLRWTPVPAVAAIVVLAAWDILDWPRIRAFLAAGPADRWAFAGTVLGTWILPLDQAIYLGVGISVALFLRRARLLHVRELRPTPDPDQPVRDVEVGAPADAEHGARCRAIAVLDVEGPLFFGSAHELSDVLLEVEADEAIRVLVVRLRRTQGVDFTAAQALRHVHHLLEKDGRHLLLVGMGTHTLTDLDDAGLVRELGPDAVFPHEPAWFGALRNALGRALELAGPPGTPAHPCADCPVAGYLHAHPPAREEPA